MVFNSNSFDDYGSLQDASKMFGPKDCWCIFRGQSYLYVMEKVKLNFLKKPMINFKNKKKYLELKRKKSKKSKKSKSWKNWFKNLI